MDIKQFKKICTLNQSRLKTYVTRKLSDKYDNVYTSDGFVYAQGDFPVLLVAHLDTVHRELPKVINIENGTISSPQGIGGDDRCGVYAILKITDKVKCSVLFCEDEEIGCVGTNSFLKTTLADALVGKFNYIIEIDRRGKNDAVFYDCDNKDFEKFITKEFYKTSYGTLSDISYIAPHLECSAVNLSSGYYKAHTNNEYVVIDEVDTCIREVVKLLNRTTESDKYEYIEAKYRRYNGYYGGYYGDYYDDYYYGGYYSSRRSKSDPYKPYAVYYRTFNGKYKGETYNARSKAEAVGHFLMEYESLTYSDIECVIECDE